MNKFVSEYKRLMLEETARGSTLAEETISSVRNAHAFGTQHKLAELYDTSNRETLRIGLKSALANGVGLGVFFFIIYSVSALRRREPFCLRPLAHVASSSELRVSVLLWHDPDSAGPRKRGRNRQCLLR